jgi:hypothetical protein
MDLMKSATDSNVLSKLLQSPTLAIVPYYLLVQSEAYDPNAYEA